MALTENCRTHQAPCDVVELNVGGQVYYTRHATLTSVPGSLLGKLFSPKKEHPNDLARDLKGRYFIDRDGFLFRYVLDFLRDKHVVLPDHFPEKGRLKREAEFFQLPELVRILATADDQDPDDASQVSDLYPASYLDPRDTRYGFITVGCNGSKSRGAAKIYVCGRLALAKEVFGDALAEGRDADRRAPGRYASRLSLKFRHPERAFEMLAESGFHVAACNSSLAASLAARHADEQTWCSYTEYVFYRGPSGWSSSHCDCCCKSHKSEREGESGTSFNEVSTSCSETHSEASSPQGTVICSPAGRHLNAQTLGRPVKKGPAQMMHQPEMRRRTDLLRARTAGPRDVGTRKRKVPKEKLTVEQELQKCIQDFRRIKIPERFPERKNMWQSELLRKYKL
ncbi:BTB/POZ domain-containing protein KCTD16a [Denticeps clupeoides]|uniref:BTB domain-containing protein n=1 Tax=Denticeps clupeoides TaxID=299321 RepID=A0AAY4ECP3_9TELE|nr:BTB/POZ domain-containing protein KCTD16-like [Denticeps clupeoides]